MAEYFSLSNTLRNAHSPAAFEQQSFLGASIVNFTLNCGMGDSSSSLNVELVIDEFNSGDTTALGFGQDIYHSGVRDRFSPPPIGSPVFFSFGHKRAPIKEAYVKTFDDLCGTTFSSPTANGYYHLTFGGILQSYTKNNSSTMGEKYSVNVVDPREILANAQMILNNYGGSNYGSTNLVNIYGFLEHNLADESPLPTAKLPVEKVLRDNGTFYYNGSDMRYNGMIPTVQFARDYMLAQLNAYGYRRFPLDFDKVIYDPRLFESSINIGSYFTTSPTNTLTRFPLTGTGFSRINNGGMPIYRIIQAINAMCGFYGPVPLEYLQAGYSSYIYFRGLKYVVDLSSLPIVDPTQRLDYDQMSVLDFCLEMCDIANHDLIVTLLPIVDICGSFYQFNLNSATPSDPPFGGIIKISTVDRSNPPRFGTLQTFINTIKNPESTDVGFELSNITSDKFLVGAQKVDQHFFTTAHDQLLPADEYKLDKQFDLQVIPYYGLINNQAVTIPKGTGPYKQILLDSSTLNANGVGDFYVATEMELRCASVSYEQWSQFLLMYNDKYLESVEANDIRDNITIAQSQAAGGNKFIAQKNNYAVTVPRCVWGPPQSEVLFSGNLPISSNFCNPPYGYPLYYKRATQIGIPEAGLVGTISKGNRIISDIEKLLSLKPDQQGALINNIYDSLSEERTYGKDFSRMEQELFNILKSYRDAIRNNQPLPNDHAFVMNSLLKNAISMVAKSKKQAKDSLRNAKRVYDFLKNIADECLGKKYLVKIPQKVNESFNYYINGGTPGNVTRRGLQPGNNTIPAPTFTHNNTLITSGPYGFMPKSINSQLFPTAGNANFVKDMLQAPPPTVVNIPSSNRRWTGALKVNRNPFNSEFEFNYYPEPNGGFYDFNMEQMVGGGPLAVRQGLIPIDASNFLTDNGRLCAYVRYDNSHFLSFDKMPQDSFTQQRKENNFFSPDVSYNLPNTTSMTEVPSPADVAANTNLSAVAFIKCTLDDKFYMPPLGAYINKQIHNGVTSKTLRGKPRKVTDPQNSCKEVDGITPMSWHFEPTSQAGGQFSVYDFVFRKNLTISNPNGNVQIFSNQGNLYQPYLQLDTRHVYALITLPDKVVPTVTTLMGQKSDANILTYMHLLFADTIKSNQDPGGFNTLQGHTQAFPPSFTSGAYRDEFSLDTWAASASEAEKKAISGLTFASQKIEFAAPSPVIPSLVALPLLSKSDCYGPWRSVMFHDLNNNQTFNQTDMLMGGKVEFIKDENLAPWNFNGYTLMDECGKSLARFLSTPMIYAERGGFTVADAPSGLSLGSIIRWQGLNSTTNSVETFYGPLITNISTSVSSDSIRTTYQCNSYTASFGRLEKKKQELISKISRNQQKIKDEKNALIRKNIGKNQNSINYNKLYKDMQQISRSQSRNDYSNIEAGKPINNNNLEIYSTQPQKQDFTIFRDNGTTQNVSGVLNGDFSAISTTHENYAEMASIMMQNPTAFFRSHYFSAIQDKTESSIAVSLEPYHPTMPVMENESMINMDYNDKIEGVTYWS